MHVKFPFGRESVLLDIPDGWVGNRVLRPLRPPAAESPGPLLEQALEHPVNSERLDSILSGESEICFLLDGVSAPETLGLVTEALVAWIHARSGGSLPRLKFLVAETRPGFKYPESFVERLRALKAPSVQVAFHSRTASICTPLRALSNGAPLSLNAAWVFSKCRILVGLVEPCPVWGYEGGRTAVLPGLAERHTLAPCLGDLKTLTAPAARPGNLRDNPFHLLALEALQTAPANFALHFTVDREGHPITLTAGHPVQSHLAAVHEHRERLEPTLAQPVNIILTGGGGDPLDATLASALQSLLFAAPLLEPDGTLVLLAPCHEGLGPPEFVESLRQTNPSGGGGETIVDDKPRGPWFWLAQQVSALLTRHEVLIHAPGVSEDDLWAFGLTPVPEPVEAVTLAMETHGQDCRIAVLPEGRRALARLA